MKTLTVLAYISATITYIVAGLMLIIISARVGKAYGMLAETPLVLCAFFYGFNGRRIIAWLAK